MNTTVTTTANGWNTATITATSAATGTVKTYRVTFRNQTLHTEHGGVRFDADNLPVWVDGSYATLKDHARQCSRCGQMFNAEYTIYSVQEA